METEKNFCGITTVGKLKQLLSGISDNLPVWLGVDSGEGYPMAETVFVANAKYLPLDGDDACGKEWEYLEGYKLKKYIVKKGEIFDEKEGCVYREVCVVGGYHAFEDFKQHKFESENATDIRRETINKHVAELRKEMAECEKELRTLEEK